MLLLWVILLPLGGALLTPVVGRVLKRNVGWWAVLVSAGAAGLLVSLAGEIGQDAVVDWAVAWPAPALGIRLSLFADGWGWTFGLIVSGIGTLICLYAQHYLSDEEPRSRFFTYLLLFESAMLGVVLSSNLIALVVFWELTSISSFLLIGFWHRLERARYGAYKALLITGLGGLALVAGVILIYLSTGTFELRELLDNPALVRESPWFTPILVLVLLGAFTKSAQFPFHLWLPDAMTAPTPVSAYLHSATMVKAGVFLLGRVHPLFRGTDQWFWIVSVVGMLTMCVGAYAAVRKTDLKAILAYSTISQLGLITTLFGFGTKTAVIAATLHIINHAVFKAGLFLVVGIVDHETGTRDKRRLAGLARSMPITAAVCGACALASAGIPLLSGFLSKELFFEEMAHHVGHGWLWWAWPALAVGGSIFTFVYSMEVFHGVFFGRLDPHVEPPHDTAGPGHGHGPPHDPGWGMLGPVALLAVVCVAIGLWPALVEEIPLRPAVTAIWQGTVEFHLALWHGINTPLMMSAVTLAGGLVIYAQRHRFAAVQERLSWPFTANTIYDGLLDGLMRGATALTDLLQSGNLRRYFWLVILSLMVGIGLVIWSAPGGWMPGSFTAIGRAEGMLAVLLVIATLTVVGLNTERLAAVISLGAVGYLISVFYLLLSAPDLALTQLLIESITVILFMLVLWKLPKQTPRLASRWKRGADMVLSVGFGAMIALLVLGVARQRATESVADYFIEATLPEAGGRNIVNVILVDFRGFDTWGEITVLAIATLGAYSLMKLRARPKEDQP